MAVRVSCFAVLLAITMATSEVTITKFTNNELSQAQHDDALRIINANLVKNPALMQFIPSGNQPMLYGLPQPRYFIMPESQGQLAVQNINPQRVSLINDRLIPFNPQSSIGADETAPTQTVDRSGTVTESPASSGNSAGQQGSGGEIFSPKAIGNLALTPLRRLFSVIG